jgi:hypothetical protein
LIEGNKRDDTSIRSLQPAKLEKGELLMYKVYKNNYFTVVKEFDTLEEARAFAAKMNRLAMHLLLDEVYFTL